MRPGVFRLVGLTVGVVLALVVLGVGAPAPAQQSSPISQAETTAPPAGHVGAESCKTCHEDQFTKFEHTRMGRLFLKQPRNMRERLACETCHGPGQKHVEAGGGKGVGEMITFVKTDKTPVARRNEVCTSCHAKGPHLFWKGSAHEARDVACASCHKVMDEVGRHNLAEAAV